jgi:hypothetical protein
MVELDALLDTRISILADMGVDLDELERRGYKHRVYDRHDDLYDYEKYQRRYIERDNKTLIRATSTELLLYLQEMIKSRHQYLEEHHEDEYYHIVVNTYPYTLTEHQVKCIQSAVAHYLAALGCKIDIDRLPIEKLDKSYVQDHNISYLFMYHYELWLNHHLIDKDTKDTTYEGLTIVSPYLVSSKMTKELAKLLDDYQNDGIHPSMITKAAFQKWVTIETIDAHWFTNAMMKDIYPPYSQELSLKENDLVQDHPQKPPRTKRPGPVESPQEEAPHPDYPEER